MKIEGWNGIVFKDILEEIQNKMGYKTQKEALSMFIKACCYNVVFEEIISQLQYLQEKEKREA